MKRVIRAVQTTVLMAGLAVVPLAAQQPMDPNPAYPQDPAVGTREYDDDRYEDDDFNWGWLGLLGLAGLAGLRRRRREVVEPVPGPRTTPSDRI